MSIKKEIVVLIGGGHKGIVKMQASSQNMVEGYCNLDYRPVGAVLYLVGDNIAEIALKDINTPFKVAFSANMQFACMIRSASVTMFGGSIPKHETMMRVDEYIRQKHADKNKKATTASDIKTSAFGTNRQSVKAENAVQNVEKVDCIKSENSAQIDANSSDNSAQINSNTSDNSTTLIDSIGHSNEGENDVKTQSGNIGSQGALPSMKDLEEWVKYDGNNFYYAVKPQLDEMFVCYPEDETLNETVQNSKWVRVEVEDGYFVVGVLFNDSEPSYICYGVPSHSNTAPPQELNDMCVWLPIENDFGYWMIYQSARNGELIK